MKIIFFGTSSFAARILRKLIENKREVVAIVTRPDRVKGRNLQSAPPPVKETALTLCPTIPLFQPEKASNPEFAETLRVFDADLFIVVAYGEIIKKNLLEMPRLSCVNIHASLLPKFRGAAPIQRCLMEGEKETGITLIEMALQMDAGDVIAMRSIPISEDTTFGELEPQLCELGATLILKTIDDFAVGNITKTPQDHSLATLAPKITPEDEKINWKRPAQQIHNQIRALSPSPCAWCEVRTGQEIKRLKIKKSQMMPGISGNPGTILSSGKEGWIIACQEGALRLLEVQLEGKKAMSAEECLRGMKLPLSMNIS